MSRNQDYILANIEQINQDLGSRIARIQLSRNISLEELAERAG